MFSSACAYGAGASPATGSITIPWDSGGFGADFSVDYAGVGSTLQSIRFSDPVTGANFHGTIGVVFPEASEELAGAQTGSLGGSSTQNTQVQAGCLTRLAAVSAPP